MLRSVIRQCVLLLGAIPGRALATATVNLSLSQPSINPGDSSSLAFTFLNSSFNTLDSAAATLNLAPGVTRATTPNVADTCAFTVSAPAVTVRMFGSST